MTGITVGKARTWREEVTHIISDLGHIAVDPTTNLNRLYKNANSVIDIKPPNLEDTSHNVFIQDYTAVLNCDIIFANLLDNPLSIGCNFELGAFYTKRLLSKSVSSKQVSIVVAPKEYHEHPFIQCHDIIKTRLGEGMDALIYVLQTEQQKEIQSKL
jgi:hypothetical protein